MRATNWKKPDLDRMLAGLSANPVRFLRSEGYPLRIIGNGGYEATLVGMQPLIGCQHAGIYRYPGGDCCHGLEEIRSGCGFAVLEA